MEEDMYKNRCSNTYKLGWPLLVTVVLLVSFSSGNLSLEESQRNAAIPSQNSPGEEIEITFINNAGFLIVSGEDKILVDALWDSGGGDQVPREVVFPCHLPTEFRAYQGERTISFNNKTLYCIKLPNTLLFLIL
jgi:hypothetical protein